MVGEKVNFYGMQHRGDCLVKRYESGAELIIPQEDLVQISLFILRGANNGAVPKRKVKK